jgi:hypothetical protein
MKKWKILITGACGVTSRSIVRSLLLSDLFKGSVFIGTDICENPYGIYEGLYEKVYRVPNNDDKRYRKVIEKILRKEKIDVAIVTPEPEVLYWTKNPFKVKSFLPPQSFSKKVISKKTLYETLSSCSCVPKYEIINKKMILKNNFKTKLPYPIWVRDYSAGSTSGKGAYLAGSYEQLKAWLIINEKLDTFITSEYLPGRNFACFLLFNKGNLLKVGIAERIDYIMSKVAMSGVTGNSSKVKLVKNETVKKIAVNAVNMICKATKEVMNGIVVVDLKEDFKKNPLVTEINIRHVAFTSGFAMAGVNFSEFHLLCALDRADEIDSILEKKYPPNNLLLRDVDGVPIFVKNYKSIKIGEKK